MHFLEYMKPPFWDVAGSFVPGHFLHSCTGPKFKSGISIQQNPQLLREFYLWPSCHVYNSTKDLWRKGKEKETGTNNPDSPLWPSRIHEKGSIVMVFVPIIWFFYFSKFCLIDGSILQLISWVWGLGLLDTTDSFFPSQLEWHVYRLIWTFCSMLKDEFSLFHMQCFSYVLVYYYLQK